MKSFICIAVFVTIFSSIVLASPTGNSGAAAPAAAAAEQDSQAEPNVKAVDVQSGFDLNRFRKAAYGSGATIPAPPCPRNYLFSCQPSLAPVACAAPPQAPSGSYSAPIPAYVNIAVPQPIAYNGYQ